MKLSRVIGLNVNRGAKICLRLRYPGDKNQFLPYENVVDTMLHELAHIVHGPHNQQFHALWDQLRDECQGLLMKGYTGEGFLGEGRRLGGARVPEAEARRLAREAAEKRRVKAALGRGSGQRLGGAGPRPGEDIRQVIARAAERRNAVLKGCGSERFNDREIYEIADTATKNGFKTQAEEDEANEAAIAQALWELVQEDEKAKYGQSYVRPSADHPGGRGGGFLISDAVGAASEAGPSNNGIQPVVGRESKDTEQGATNGDRQDPVFWVCGTCTLHNPQQYLCCEACGSERTQAKRPRSRAEDHATEPAKKKPGTTTTSTASTIDLTGDSPQKPKKHDAHASKKQAHVSSSSPPPGPASNWVWICSFCGTAMERQWWTCSVCGKMKESSK